MVIGTVCEPPYHEAYRIDLGGTQDAMLPILAFEGATRRHRPMLKIGDLVYAKIANIHSPHLPIELTCRAQTQKQSWVTGQSEFGPLKGGMATHVVNNMEIKSLLSKNNPLLEMIGTCFAFELVIGLNGYIWFKSNHMKHTMALLRIFEHMDDMTPEYAKKIIESL